MCDLHVRCWVKADVRKPIAQFGFLTQIGVRQEKLAKNRRWKSPTGKVWPTHPTPSDARGSAREGSREAFTGETTGQVLSCETGLIPRCRSRSVEEKATSSHGVSAFMGKTSRRLRSCGRGRVLFDELR